MSESASGTFTVVELTPTSFQYTITITDTGPTAIGSFWLSWLPLEDFLPHPSTAQTAPSGWGATLENGGVNGSSIQYVASSPSLYIQAGGTLGGFTFTSPDAPAVLQGDSAKFPGTPILTSVVFKAGILVDAGGTFDVACFAAGTRILTARGEIPVERLAPGDLVPTLLGDRLVPVRWLGHRGIDCRRHPRPEAVWPVRVRAGAFGADRPARDLLLSPDHAVYLDNLLIPIRYLVNGATIAPQPVDHIEYWHVELPTHEVLLADGLPVESYLDTGNRAAFANGGSTVLAHPDFARRAWTEAACAPLVVSGAALTAAKQTLLRRAEALGYRRTTDPVLYLVVDGAVLFPETDGSDYRFDLPDGARQIRLRSLTAVPAQISADSTDCRRLGVAVTRLAVDGMAMPLAGVASATGWHAGDISSDWRWTDGDATVDCAGANRLELTILPVLHYWVAGMAAAAVPAKF